MDAATAAAAPQPAPGSSRKGVYYSQPLGRDASARRSNHRNHSLDDNRICSPAADDYLHNPHHHEAPRSYSYPYCLSDTAAEDLHLSLPPGSHLPPLHPARRATDGSASDSDGSITLDRAMSVFGGGPGTLPESVGNGGGKGIFRVPLRAAMHPGRPPPLEVRPHPLREAQAGSFLRTLAYEPQRGQLWAGAESGLRVWSLAEVFDGWDADGPRPRKGDEETAPFRESAHTSPTMCLVVDGATGLIWSGHKDGKVRSWRLDQPSTRDSAAVEDGGAATGYQFKEGLSWQAHSRTPVLSMVITSSGEIWTGSEGGVIKAWPWDAIRKSLSLSIGERHMAALLVERSYVDLRSHVTVGGVCSLPPTDVKYMLADNSRSKIWSSGSLTFALWDARTRDLLKVFGIDGQVETRVEAMAMQETDVEDEMKAKLVSTSKKEKSRGSFLQRSRNALMGAADAVRRVATKGTFVEDNRRTGALAMAMDGMIWSGCTNGLLIQWDGNGNWLNEVQHHSSSVQCIGAFGVRLWVGYASGTVQVLDLEGCLLGEWVAHSCPVIKMTVGGPYIFTLAHHGGIRGWYLTSPGPLDDILRTELANRELSYTKQENLNILVGTWNCAQEKASPDSLKSWLANVESDIGLVVVGLQEVDMGAGFLAMAAAKETVGLEGSANGQWWLAAIGKALGEGTSFERVGSRQLAALLISAWARKDLRPHIGDVDAAAVPCGFGRAIGNKGAAGLRMRVYDRRLCFVGCHFAAHLEAVSRRNADFDHVYRTMSFSRPSIGLQGAAAGPTSVQLHRAANASVPQSDDSKSELSDTDMVVFLGDFNYRLHSITYDEARDMVSQRCFDWLRGKDQLRAEMKAGRVFQGMREGQITFPPTYKFQKQKPGLSGYDSGEKKRIPAWCDRILYRDSRSIAVAECSLDCPVVASITQYEACMDVCDSDHKPVRCVFRVEIARVDEFIRRQAYGDIVKSDERVSSLLKEFCDVPETIVSTNNIILQNQETTILRITNKCEINKASYEIICEGQSTVMDGNPSELCSRGCFGFPPWLEVVPAIGILKPGQTVEVTVRHEEHYTQEEFVDGIPQNWWCEDTKDKEVVLLVNVTGCGSTDRKTHRIQVRHCFSSMTSSKTSSNDTKAPRKRNQSNHLHRSDFAQFESSEVYDLCRMRCP